MTRPGKTGLIYTKYTCLYYGTYLLFCMCYPNSVSFIEFLIDFCTYDDVLDTIQITDKKLLHFKLSKSGQILCVDKTCFPRPGHILFNFVGVKLVLLPFHLIILKTLHHYHLNRHHSNIFYLMHITFVLHFVYISSSVLTCVVVCSTIPI